MSKKFMHGLKIKKIGLVTSPANKREFLLFKSADCASDEDEVTVSEKKDKGKASLRDVVKERIASAVDSIFAGITPDADVDGVAKGEDETSTISAETINKEEIHVADVVDNNGEKTVQEVTVDKSAASEPATVSVELYKAQQIRLEALEKELKAERDIRKQREESELESSLVMLAKSLQYIPETQENLVTVLKSVHGTDQFNVVSTMLKKINRMIANAPAFSDAARSDFTIQKGGQARLHREMENIRKQAGNEKMSDEEAMSLVFKQNPDLYEEVFPTEGFTSGADD